MKQFSLLIFLMLSLVLKGQSFDKVKGMVDYQGYFNFHYDESKDKIYLEVDKLETEFLYVNSLAAGLGSNDIGLDRGKLGNTAVVKFIKAGNKLLLIQPNLKYRAISDNIEEKKSVQEAFAQSVLFGFPIVEKNGSRYLIDITSFLMQDSFGVGRTLKSNNQGTYKLDLSKSSLFLDRTKGFPKNVEFEAMLTFTGEAKYGYVNSVTPNAAFVTVRQHHSFVQLPDSDYKMRKFDTRSGAISMSYLDYATPVEKDIKKRFIIRHRLQKKDPSVAISEAVEPIIYYLDRGAPEPIKSALLEGGSWWNQAFEAAGYRNAFQIKVLPEGVDPLDIRYNVVQWVHRSTRGWSYGGSIVDPRTGEILKGHVSLGSLRIRQDYLIAQALLGASEESGADNPLLQLALARIRQLSAHEIGHTLGFTHNFAASFNNRASVMDYPHPKYSLLNGKINADGLYDIGIGAWDKVTVAYSYQDFPNTVNEDDALNAIINNALTNGLKFISDSDSRARGGAHPYAHLWDNGSSPVSELENVLNVRKTAIGNFSLKNINSNEPLTKLEDVFVPLYFFHRYQIEAVVKMIGGLEYNYAVAGDNQVILKPIDPKEEKKALNGLLHSISTENLMIPEHIVALFPPRAYGYSRSRESFKSMNGVAFDALNAAATATNLVTELLLHPERASRMIQQKALYNNQLGFDEVVDELINVTFKKNNSSSYANEVQQAINVVVLENLLALSVSNKASFQVKSIILAKIKSLKMWLKESSTNLSPEYYKLGYIQSIENYFKNPDKFKKASSPKIPDGSPIGTIDCSFGHF